MSTPAFESVNLESTMPSFKLDSLKFAANSAYDPHSFNVADLGQAGADVVGYPLGTLTIRHDGGNDTNDDFGTVTSPPQEPLYDMRKENESAMNRPLPVEYPQLSAKQEEALGKVLPLVMDFFEHGGFQGGNPELINALSALLKDPQFGGVLDQSVVDTINKRLAEKGLYGRISSAGGETFLGTRVQQPPGHYVPVAGIGKAVQ